MKEKPNIFNSWVRDWMKMPLLIVALFPHVMLMSIFHSNSTFTASIIDVDIDNLQFLISVMYAGIIVILLINNRFFSYFPIKTYVLLATSCSIFLLLIILVVKDYALVMPLRVLEGIFCVLEGAIFIPIIISEIKSKHARLFSYFILYAVLLTGSTLTTFILKTALTNFGWTEMFYIVIVFHIALIGIALFLFNGNRFFPKMPLYQVDWTSCLLLLISLNAGAFAIIFGRRYYWFQSERIIYAVCICLFFAGLFIYRQLHLRRKVFHFEVLKFKQVRIGILLFFLYYLIKSGVNNLYTVMLKSWNWPWEFIVDVQFYCVAGIILGIVTSGYLLIRGFSNKMIFSMGFLIFAIDCYWISTIFSTDITVTSIGYPLFFNGLAQGWIFTPLVMFIINGLPAQFVGNGALMGTATRFWTTNIGFAFAQNVTYNLLQKNYDMLQANIDLAIPKTYEKYNQVYGSFVSSNEESLAHRLTLNNLHSEIYNQSLLLANMQLFRIYMWIALITCLFILLIVPNRNKMKKFVMKFGIYK